MGILPDGAGRGRGGLGRTEGRAARGEWSTEKEVGQAGVEYHKRSLTCFVMNWI